MITATEALELPGAQLDGSEKKEAVAMLADIETFIRNNMKRRGCDYQTTVTNANVIAEVVGTLKQAKWAPLVYKMSLPSRVEGAPSKHIGFRIEIAPSDEAVKERGQIALSTLQ